MSWVAFLASFVKVTDFKLPEIQGVCSLLKGAINNDDTCKHTWVKGQNWDLQREKH